MTTSRINHTASIHFNKDAHIGDQITRSVYNSVPITFDDAEQLRLILEQELDKAKVTQQVGTEEDRLFLQSYVPFLEDKIQIFKALAEFLK